MNAKTLMLLAIMSPLAVAEDTVEAEIHKLQFNANTGWFYAWREDGWGACNNTRYAHYDGKPEHKELFVSLVLPAFMTNRKVVFSGTCTNANGYLDVNYLHIFK